MSKLVCFSGMNKGDEFALHEGKNVIGRGQDCTVVLFDKKCSRHHCQIIKKGKHYAIEDLDSSNGTLLNGKPVTKTMGFEPGEKIMIGATTLSISEKAVGGFLDQTATDVAADLQAGEYKKLLSTASRDVAKSHRGKKNKGIGGFFKSLFGKKK